MADSVQLVQSWLKAATVAYVGAILLQPAQILVAMVVEQDPPMSAMVRDVVLPIYVAVAATALYPGFKMRRGGGLRVGLGVLAFLCFSWTLGMVLRLALKIDVPMLLNVVQGILVVWVFAAFAIVFLAWLKLRQARLQEKNSAQQRNAH